MCWNVQDNGVYIANWQVVQICIMKVSKIVESEKGSFSHCTVDVIERCERLLLIGFSARLSA